MMTRNREILEQRRDTLNSDAKRLEAQVQQRLRNIDRFHTERLCKRYSHLVPPERIQRVKDLPTRFEGQKDFQQHYREACGSAPPEDIKVLGYSQGTLESAHVDMDDLQVRKTMVHERVHQLSDPRARELLGERFCEGVTEDLAIKELGQEPNSDLPRSYPRERAMARQARELCGDRPVDRAYFKGDVSELRSCLEDRLGKENLDNMKQVVEKVPPVQTQNEESRV